MPSCHELCGMNNMDKMIILVPLEVACHQHVENTYVQSMQTV